ncbi:BPSL0067 family protein [Burkholderia sp. SCN-KJ]|uniref:BPSL0067 family protein n=1 Tax=Burkholderia sp. SCN-KJ TaxID=2969248 RepID=UPI00214FCA79|nr:BPSL0067 family protein [Burkholderia sp. SCN-KJ]MCR4465092.1 BPSL0067 family protein [Burkholderia sp. SCN-KJ]
MAHVYEKAADLVGQKLAGDGECVALVKIYTSVGPTAIWRPEKKIGGDGSIRAGTVIATFENDRYPSRSHGNHAAFYLGQDVRGIHVVEQWRSLKAIQRRCIPFKGKDKNGRYIDPSNNADAFSVVK